MSNIKKNEMKKHGKMKELDRTDINGRALAVITVFQHCARKIDEKHVVTKESFCFVCL